METLATYYCSTTGKRKFTRMSKAVLNQTTFTLKILVLFVLLILSKTTREFREAGAKAYSEAYEASVKQTESPRVLRAQTASHRLFSH